MRARKVKGYVCPECEEKSKEPPERRRGYRCPKCDEIHEAEELTRVPAWLCSEVDDEEGGLTIVEPKRVEAVQLGCDGVVEADTDREPDIVDLCEHECGCITDDVTDAVDLYECGECGELYEDRDDARDCCRA